ncbi:MAG: hypothetical protein KGI38_10285 [Thaumarchaeota archaeon]|nr:hypothetical protein [Nitrososphaerota archaeon]
MSSARGRRVALVAIVAAGLIVASSFFVALSYEGGGSPVIRVGTVWSDRVDTPETRQVYLMELNLSNTASKSWDFNPVFLVLGSNASLNYSPDGGYNGTRVLGATTIPQGGRLIGYVAFDLPVKEIPSRLSYHDQTAGISLEAASVPEVSAVASKFNYNAYLTVNGTGPIVQGSGWGFGSVIMNGFIENDTRVFFTGQVVKLDLWFEYLKRPVDPSSITIESVSVENGFQVVGVDTVLPLNMTGWGSQAGIVFLLKVPPGQHTGNIDVAVRISA